MNAFSPKEQPHSETGQTPKVKPKVNGGGKRLDSATPLGDKPPPPAFTTGLVRGRAAILGLGAMAPLRRRRGWGRLPLLARSSPCSPAGQEGTAPGPGGSLPRRARASRRGKGAGAAPAAAGRGGRRPPPSCVRCRGWGRCCGRRGGGGGRRAAASAPWPATARSSGGGPTLPITASTLVSSSAPGLRKTPSPSFLPS